MRLIDGNALIAEMHNVILEDGEDRSIFYEVIERQPTIEQPEIIRCRDCVWHSGKHVCRNKNSIPWNDDDFCSWAERREVSE